jgi:hypothetical protein
MEQWYCRIGAGEPLCQGQIFDSIELLLPTYQVVDGRPEVGKLPSEKIIVLTQTCDIVRPEKGHSVLVAPVTKIPQSQTKDKATLGNLRRYRNLQFYLLPADRDFGMDFSTVRFAMMTGMPLEVLAALARGTESIALRSPFREHFAHTVGTLFSRVALPEPPFDEGAWGEYVKAATAVAAPTAPALVEQVAEDAEAVPIVDAQRAQDVAQ